MFEKSGILLIDKPIGLTSHDVVYKVRKHLGGLAVGHAGTLDPLASGLLVMLIGEGTKLSRLILSQQKSYHVKAKLGLKTDSWDTDGKTLSQEDVQVDAEQIQSAFLQTLSMKEFPLPVFSAVKVKGKKLYEYARKDIDIEVPLRQMNFFDGELLNVSHDHLEFTVYCDKGGYIRSLAHVIGDKLGVGGTVSFLRRTRSHPYDLAQAKTLDDVLSVERNEVFKLDCFHGLADILNPFKGLTVSGRDERLMLNGAIPNEILRRTIFEQKQANKNREDTYIKVIGADLGRIISLLHIAPNTRPKVFRTFN